MTLEALNLILWVRNELGGDVYLEPVRGQPGYVRVRMRAPALRDRLARQKIVSALNRHGTGVVQALLVEQRTAGPAHVGAEMVDWAQL
jgi:hypothetical protein